MGPEVVIIVEGVERKGLTCQWEAEVGESEEGVGGGGPVLLDADETGVGEDEDVATEGMRDCEMKRNVVSGVGEEVPTEDGVAFGQEGEYVLASGHGDGVDTLVGEDDFSQQLPIMVEVGQTVVAVSLDGRYHESVLVGQAVVEHFLVALG